LSFTNNCSLDTYKLPSKSARQKGKISPNLLLTISRQISKFVKILYIKAGFNVMGDMIYISYGDRVGEKETECAAV